jgi:hypothetical protein
MKPRYLLRRRGWNVTGRTIIGPEGWRSTWDFHRRLTDSLGVLSQVFTKLGCDPPPGYAREAMP